MLLFMTTAVSFDDDDDVDDVTGTESGRCMLKKLNSFLN